MAKPDVLKLNMVICSGCKPDNSEEPMPCSDPLNCSHAKPHHRNTGCSRACACHTGVKYESQTCHSLVTLDQWWDEQEVQDGI